MRKSALLLAAIALVSFTSCGGDDDDGTESGGTGGGTTGETGPALARVTGEFCQHFLPSSGVVVDIGIVTDEDPTTSDEEIQLLAIAASRATLEKMSAELAADASAFEELGEKGLAAAARSMSEGATDLIEADDADAIVAAIDGLTPEEDIEEGVCKEATSPDYFRGYLDGWLAKDPAEEGDEYTRGYETGFEDGWRDDAAESLDKAQGVRDSLAAVLNAGGAYDRILQLPDSDLDRVGRILCEDARQHAPVDRRESAVLAHALMKVFPELDLKDAVVATVNFLYTYCFEVLGV